MTLRDKISQDAGFQYVVDSMELMSSAGRNRLLNQPFVTDRTVLESECSNTARIIAMLNDSNSRRQVQTILHQMMQMHDLQGTISHLQHHFVIEEVELFEVKHFAFLCQKTNQAAGEAGIAEMLDIPDLSEVFRMLDPDNTGIPGFYIYDSYHPELHEVRKQLREKQTRLEGCGDDKDENARLMQEISDLYDRQSRLQQQVMEKLSEQLSTHFAALSKAYDRMAYTDMIFSRAELAVRWGLCRPRFTDVSMIEYSQLFNPRLRHHKEEAHERYQPLNVGANEGVCLITGANMAGKTVLLKTLGVAQMMAQFCLYVPAAEALMTTVDDVVLCVGDEQNEMHGLSSYASEIMKISSVIDRSENEKLLVLIDEPARTTNPVEGKAIVQGVASLLDRRNSITLITTHYSQLGLKCRRLRVRGFVDTAVDGVLTPENINDYMDYSLLPDDNDDVPQEAMRIASILHCNKQLLDETRIFIKKGRGTFMR